MSGDDRARPAGRAPRDERRDEQRGRRPTGVDTTTTTDESRVSPTTTDAGTSAAGDGDDAIPPPQAATGPLRLTVSASTVASYAPVAVRSTDPCPAGTQWVEVDIQAVGGSMDGQGVGGDQLRPDAAGHWSVDAGIAAVGRIEDVAWAMTADQLDVRARCRDRDQRLWPTTSPSGCGWPPCPSSPPSPPRGTGRGAGDVVAVQLAQRWRRRGGSDPSSPRRIRSKWRARPWTRMTSRMASVMVSVVVVVPRSSFTCATRSWSRSSAVFLIAIGLPPGPSSVDHHRRSSTIGQGNP